MRGGVGCGHRCDKRWPWHDDSRACLEFIQVPFVCVCVCRHRVVPLSDRFVLVIRAISFDPHCAAAIWVVMLAVTSEVAVLQHTSQRLGALPTRAPLATQFWLPSRILAICSPLRQAMSARILNAVSWVSKLCAGASGHREEDSMSAARPRLWRTSPLQHSAPVVLVTLREALRAGLTQKAEFMALIALQVWPLDKGLRKVRRSRLVLITPGCFSLRPRMASSPSRTFVEL